MPAGLADKTQDAEGVKRPVLLLENDMIPVGADGEVPVSVTVSVQVEELFTGTELGTHCKEVVVEWTRFTVIVRVGLVFTRVPEVALTTRWYIVDVVEEALKVIVEVWVAPPIKVTLLGA